MSITIPVSFLQIRLVHYGKLVPMNQGKGNIIRSICRSLEILLFFVITVVGFGLFSKTTSLNTKTKVKSLLGGPVAPRALSLPELTIPCGHYRFFSSPQKKESSPSAKSTVDHLFCSIMQHENSFLRYCSSNQKREPISSPLSQPGNLFQQNSVLLI